jgi:hypothetical protein
MEVPLPDIMTQGNPAAWQSQIQGERETGRIRKGRIIPEKRVIYV